MNIAYLTRVARDLYMRASTIVVNSEHTVPVKSAHQDGSNVVIVAEPIRGVTQITSLRLLDEQGGLITEKTGSIDVTDRQALEFTFRFEVKGGTIDGV
ncbi:hypothetical protein [Aneurinibacillus migulanus]|uniref:hypothetical protein n=1 Tax=Aneurinibacillus migulanus TaxID=47500 RepID=UPI00209C7316|nr:hypothetical protein [Aneurinibacillus migulanus]MCP1354674.1 hypothetical protein [Aneurinibacillus migulanus]